METLTVPGKLESLTTVTEYVLQAAANANLDYRATYRLRLAIDEIVTNIITHGYQQRHAGMITMSAEIDEEYLTIYMEDTGPNYNPYDATLPESLWRSVEERQIGGLGIYLAMTGVDHFQYRRHQQCNRSMFRMLRQKKYH